MKTNRYARFFALVKQINSNGMPLSKEDAVLDYTKSHSSLSALTDVELSGLERHLSAMTTRSQAAPFIPADPIGDKLRKGIISQFLSIGRSVDDAKAWAEKMGVKRQKRLFNDYDHQELYLLFQNAKKMKRDYIKAINK